MKSKNTVITTKDENKYQITSELGKGGMSVVYKANHITKDSKQAVLIKVFTMPDNDNDSERFKSHVHRELDINQEINKMEFAGAITIGHHEYDSNDDIIYGVISNVRYGMTLREYVSKEKYMYMPLKEKIILIKHLSQLVENFHKKCGMIHGDITPDNIYVLDTENGGEGEYNTHVALYDFGSVQHIKYEENVDMPVYATDGYAKKDILQGVRKRLTEDDDWYAVRSCAWFCLSRKLPVYFK